MASASCATRRAMPDSPVAAGAALTERDLAVTQRRTVRVLAAGQVLTGVAFGATLSLGHCSPLTYRGRRPCRAWPRPRSPLARLSPRSRWLACRSSWPACGAHHGKRRGPDRHRRGHRGRRAPPVPAAARRNRPHRRGNAATLQSRFAATDLASTARRGRDLATVVWATTVGGVVARSCSRPASSSGPASGCRA